MKNQDEAIKIIHSPSEKEPFVVLKKKSGLPTAPLSLGENSALFLAEKLFPEIKAVSGKKEIEHGLIHRIDTETSGLVLIATSQDFFDFLIEAQKNGQFKKWYRANVDLVSDISALLEGFPKHRALTESETVTVQSQFRYFGRKNQAVRPVTNDSGMAAKKKCERKIYSTQIQFDSAAKIAICSIVAGFRHQVRAHLALCGIPVRGDKLYNPNFKEGEELSFEAFRLEFPKKDGGTFVFEI